VKGSDLAVVVGQRHHPQAIPEHALVLRYIEKMRTNGLMTIDGAEPYLGVVGEHDGGVLVRRGLLLHVLQQAGLRQRPLQQRQRLHTHTTHDTHARRVRRQKRRKEWCENVAPGRRPLRG